MTTDVDEDDEYDIFEQSGYLRYAREDAEFTLEHFVTLAVTNDYYGAVAFSVLARDLGVDVETLKARLTKLVERGYITLQEVQCREDIAEYWKPNTPNEESAILVPGIVMSYLPPDGLAWSDLSKAFRAATGRGDGNSLSSASMKVLAADATRLRELATMRASSRPRLHLISGGKIDPTERGPYCKGRRRRCRLTHSALPCRLGQAPEATPELGRADNDGDYTSSVSLARAVAADRGRGHIPSMCSKAARGANLCGVQAVGDRVSPQASIEVIQERTLARLQSATEPGSPITSAI